MLELTPYYGKKKYFFIYSINDAFHSFCSFQVLWKLRYQVWPRMEEGAHVLFKIPPPGIEFTLPSPKIGIESLEVVDSPWELLVKTKVEEVTINQERHVRQTP